MRGRPRSLCAVAALLLTQVLSSCGPGGSTPERTGGSGARGGEVATAALGRVVARKKCAVCHVVEGEGGILGKPLDESIVLAGREVADYSKRVSLIRGANESHYARNKKRIEPLLDMTNSGQRLEAWLRIYLRNPKFDDPDSRMNAVVLSETEMENVIVYLLSL